MKPLIILQGIIPDDLIQQIESIVERKLEDSLSKLLQKPKKFSYMTRKEVAEYLRISLPTLHEWTKMEWIKSYKISSRVLFRNDEVEQDLKIRRFRS